MRSAARSSSFLPVPNNHRRFIAWHLTIWLLLILGAVVVLSSALASAPYQISKRASGAGQDRRATSAAAVFDEKDLGPAAPAESPTPEQQLNVQSQSVPFLTRQNAPDIPQCREIVNQEILDLVNAASEDPAEIFEQNRRAHPHMIMMPPPLDCASKLWAAARRSNRASEAVISPELLSQRQNPIEKFFNLGALNASVGSNTDPGNGVEGYQGENSISIDPNNPLHLIAFSNTFFKDPTATCQSPTGGSANTFGTMALFGSTDGGATWTYNCAPWPATVSGGVTGSVFWFGSDPALSWDSQGRAYACYMLISQSASGASGAAIVMARSSDNGASWQNLGTVVNGIASTTQGNDKEMMAIDNTSGQAFSHPGRIYVIWDAANAEKIAYSDDGAAWTTVNFPSNTGAIGGNIVVGTDGAVYTIWTRYNVETIVLSKSTDGGATWTAPQVIATLALQSFGSNNKPPAQDKRGINGFGSIDLDRNPVSPFFGNLYVSFPDFPSGTTTGVDLNTYVIRSTNSGTSWSSRVKVNDDNFGATQIFPWLAVDQSDGTVNVSWYDSRLDPLNRQTQMVSSRSVDGGVSFEPNILVSDGGAAWRNNVNYEDENSADNTAYNGNQYGDYSGIAAFNRQVHPLWTDSRMFFPLADTQSPTRREDNATATITYCSAPSVIGAPAVNPSTAPSVAVSWSAPAGWGTNATNGTYSIFRNTSTVFPSASPLASDLTSTSYVDTTGVSGATYYYFIRAKNNCPGTALTPMSTDSPASAAVEFGSTGTPTGILQGSVTASGSPVSGVIVTAGTLSATTNASGFYVFVTINAATYTVSASPGGYNPVSVNGVVVTDGGTTVQNLALTPVTSGSCFTDTTYADFSPGAGSNIDIAGNPGDVKLRNLGVEATDQISSPAALSTTNNLSATTWTGQTFRAGVTGNLTKMNIGLGLASGSSGTITVEIRNLNGINPGTTVLATATAGPVTNVGTAALYTVTFATPAAVVSGTSYSIVLRTSVGSTVFGVRGSAAGGSSLANGQVFTTTTSGTAWTAVAADLWFTTYVTPPLTYFASGDLISAVKDANPVVGLIPRWLTLSWNATTPANTTIQFQAAASNNVNGPFNFVGPDGTTSTFFTTSAASLSQFNGFRYLKYEALLSTTDNIVTPTLTDVTVCFDNDTPLITAVAPLSRQEAAGASNSQIATVSDPGQAANTLTVTSTPLTGSGVIITNISIDVAGKVTADIAASCAATNSTFTLTVTNSASATAIATLTVNITPSDTPTITPDGPTTFCTGGSVTLTSSSASGNQWVLDGNPIGGATNQAYVATAAGDYTNTVTTNGCTSASSSATTVIVNPIPATPTSTPDGPTTFCNGGSVTLTSSSATGNQWYLNGNPIGGATNQTYIGTASGNYTVTETATGCASAPSNATTVTVNPIPATPSITPDGPTTFCAGGSVTLTSSSATGNQWYLNGNPIGGATNQGYIATAAGDYTVTETATGCTSGPSAATAVTVNPLPATPTITPDGPTTFCSGGSVTLTSSSATGNQWYLDGNPIGGATNQTYVGTASGNYTVTETATGCASAPSAATTVTVNPTPSKPVVTAGGPTTFCAGGSVTLSSNSATGIQWYLDGNPIGGATSQNYIANASGDYTSTLNALGCVSSASDPISVTVNRIPETPTIAAGGPTTFCAGGSVTLTSSSTSDSGSQWYLNGNPIGGATNSAYLATSSGDYTVTDTASGCTSAPSANTAVTVNPIPATPTITPGGPTTFTIGGSVTLTSSSVSGNQWSLNGNPIGGETNQDYVANASGNYTVTVSTLGCISAPSLATTVTVNPFHPPTISKLFLPDTVTANGTTLLSFTISNPSSDPELNLTLTGIAFTDNLPDGLVIASANELSNNCGGTVTATPGSSFISLSGGSLAPAGPDALHTGKLLAGFSMFSKSQALENPAQGSCFISVKVQAPSALGTLNNTTGPITSTESEPGTTSNTATLTVIAPPLPATIVKAFGAASIPLNGITSLTFTLTNPNSTLTLMNVSASDTLPTGLVVANPSSLTGTCGGDIFANPGSNTLGITALTLPATSSCSFSVNVKGTGAGTKNNTSDNVTATYDDGTGDFVNIVGGMATATIEVLKGNQTITFGVLPNKTFGDADFTVSATASSGLAVSFTAAGDCSVTNVGTVHLGSAGSCTITASHDGDSNYNAATSVAQSFVIAQSNQTISFSALADKVVGDPDFSVSATTTSGLAISFSAGGQCTIAGTVVHLTGVGLCTITASQAGDSNYNAATAVVQSFNIAQAATTTVLSSSTNPSDIGQSVTFTATITSANTSAPTGTVQFKDGVDNLGSAVNCVSGGGNSCIVQFSTATLTTGTHAISAIYSGDTNFVGSSGLLSGGQIVTSQPALLLILDESDPAPNQAAALDSLLLLRDPFPVQSIASWLTLGPDRNTRVMVFVANLHLNPEETSSAVVVNLIDSINQSYDVPAEDVRLNLVTGYAQVTFRLPDTLFVGACTVTVKAHGQVTNSAFIRIGP